MSSDVHPSATARQSRRLGLRLGLGAAAAVLVAVPFTLLTVLVLGKYETLERADRAVADAFNAQVLPRPWLARTFDVLATVTDPNTWRVLAFVLAVVLWRRGRRRLVYWLATTMVVGGLLGPLLKELVARARPTFADPVSTASGYSFPSGHALNSMLFAAVLVVLAHPATRGARRALVWAVAVVIVLVTAVDRLALGVHFASDVLAGWVVALATVCGTTAAFAVWRAQEGLPPSSPETGLEPPRSTE
ncbi:phosphatase PAP2 family protein [Kineosporia sp. R_H_3]|uniref:phosphatase PAP2 family protein n=1 Tax=Kineosporia sp. R_H_3 TaxID=1961848 RepID=UPI000B4AB39C|nr:phosphatase PAP2 family protein [Kineosporia sp. R_H_3]